jgi:hypothetical protein
MVAVRTLATKVVLREDELIELGLPSDYLASGDRVTIRKALASKFVEAAQGLLLSVHDNAPFYPAPIRKAANDTHGAAKDLIDQTESRSDPSGEVAQCPGSRLASLVPGSLPHERFSGPIYLSVGCCPRL